jgi:predicted ATPase
MQSFHPSDDDKISTCTARLESKGIPWALCTLVHNLLDCSKGDFSKDEAYASLADLLSEYLQLMYFDPSRFLDNIEISPLPPLTITNKLYGREDEIAKMKVSYQQFFSSDCSGIIVKGGAGVGKSRLAIDTLQSLTSQRNGYFLAAKFDQNQDVKPLSTVGTLFSSLCDLFVQDATPAHLTMVNELLESSLGGQAGLLSGVVPSLSKLMPSCAGLESSSGCVDSALSMQFLFAELLNVVSSFSRPISLLLDDMQWADIASLLLVGNLLSVVIGGSKSVFFAFCYRDDEVSNNGAFNAWLSSITMFPLEAVKLENMTAEDVNRLVSDALHLSPRITRPLSSILHRKTGGNPLFLRQLMYSLNNQNHIRVQLNPVPRWVWDLNKIVDMKISDDVVALLLKDMQRLPTDLRLGLEVASCFGSCVKSSILDILSKSRQVDLQDVLQQASKRGFVDNVGGTMFCFAHDKIQQAAYELMSEEKRRANHIDFGLHLSLSLSNDTENDELFFLAVNQMNRGGPNAVLDPSQKFVFAGLNLRAGRRAIDLSDYNAAFQLFQHGISFLGDNHKPEGTKPSGTQKFGGKRETQPI